MFLSGVTLLIGPSKTFGFFFQKRKWKGTSTFIIGIIMVLFGWTFIGFFVEGFGFINLFGNFFPWVLASLAKIPVIGSYLCGIPGVQEITERISPGGVPKMPI
eukprot:TRINITY_DN1808_c0_g1_i2.p2 TRINITY_DN1808_c0_g1~~TRINITY_DN1808_c0_g1_i2.p2  ORF type:complete len:103 (+),score=8.37 TRINITY_DN1808_c0_g1_i2:12-320(+)